MVAWLQRGALRQCFAQFVRNYGDVRGERKLPPSSKALPPSPEALRRTRWRTRKLAATRRPATAFLNGDGLQEWRCGSNGPTGMRHSPLLAFYFGRPKVAGRTGVPGSLGVPPLSAAW